MAFIKSCWHATHSSRKLICHQFHLIQGNVIPYSVDDIETVESHVSRQTWILSDKLRVVIGVTDVDPLVIVVTDTSTT